MRPAFVSVGGSGMSNQLRAVLAPLHGVSTFHFYTANIQIIPQATICSFCANNPAAIKLHFLKRKLAL